MDFPAQQSDIIGRRQEGTGQWFLDDPAFAKWLSQPKETLFCPGIPGAGKTMIAAIVIDHLLKAVQSSAVGVAYVYCNYKAQGEQDAASLLAAILKQLVQTRPSIVEPVERLRKKYANLGTNKPSADETFGALQSVIAEFSTTYVVVDALDESPNGDGTRHRFLGQLRALQAKSDVRLVFTSRFIPDIVDEFREAPTLEVRAHEEDVRRFVAGQIYRLPKCIQRDAALRDMVQEKVTRAVDGMQVLPVARCSSTSSPSLRFLLARLYLDSLLDKRTKHKVQSRLETLSKGSKALEKAYEDAIKRIKGQLPEDAALASTVLSWIIYAQRALTIAEIRHALAVEPDQDDLNLDNLPDVEDIVSVCAGLVAIDEESNIIRLVHYTTQEYFEHIRDQWNPNAQLEITSTCLTYLSFAAFESGSCSTDEEFESRLEQSVFLDYAARYWGIHATTVQDEVYELARSFLLHSGLISCAVQVMSAPDYKHRGYSQTYPENTTGLHITAQFGLHRLSEILLHEFGGETTFSVCAEDSRGQTPLVLAAKRGHEPMVKLLLDNGSDANAELYCGSALQAASYEGQEQIVKLLLDNGADANAQGGPYRNALLAASCSGHEQIIKLLLNNGADVNAPGEPYSRALQIASSRGHEQIVKLLLNNGADVNANVPSRGRTKWIGSFT